MLNILHLRKSFCEESEHDFEQCWIVEAELEFLEVLEVSDCESADIGSEVLLWAARDALVALSVAELGKIGDLDKGFEEGVDRVEVGELLFFDIVESDHDLISDLGKDLDIFEVTVG